MVDGRIPYELGARKRTRTFTPFEHYHLKVACLPISPPAQWSIIIHEGYHRFASFVSWELKKDGAGDWGLRQNVPSPITWEKVRERETS